MKITDYPQATELSEGDSFIVDNPEEGTRYIKQENLPFGEGGGSVPTTDPSWVSHRNAYRGKPLGSVFTDEQKEAISSQKFTDLYIGDYWTIGNFDWIIADINYWLGTGDTKCTTPHLVIVPKTSLYDVLMYSTNATNGGYSGSSMRYTGLDQAKTIIYTAFGENNILNHRELFSNQTNHGYPSSSAWMDSKVDLMNQIMTIGSYDTIATNPDTNVLSNYKTIDTTQLSLFKIRRDLIPINEAYWLRDLNSSSTFAFINDNGNIDWAVVTTNFGVRPAFGLTGETN